VATALEDPVDDRGGQVVIVEDATPGVEGLVGGEDHRAVLEMALVDDVEEQVGGIVPASEIPDLVDQKNVRADVLGERLAQAPLPARHREVLDEGRRGGAARVESVLDGTVADGNR
jgi:hypothetical protein